MILFPRDDVSLTLHVASRFRSTNSKYRSRRITQPGREEIVVKDNYPYSSQVCLHFLFFFSHIPSFPRYARKSVCERKKHMEPFRTWFILLTTKHVFYSLPMFYILLPWEMTFAFLKLSLFFLFFQRKTSVCRKTVINPSICVMFAYTFFVYSISSFAKFIE